MDVHVVAVLIGEDWYLARPAEASEYGLLAVDGGTSKVWSELRTTALLCRVGQERASYVLPTPKEAHDG